MKEAAEENKRGGTKRLQINQKHATINRLIK